MASDYNGSSRNLFDTLFTLVKVEKDENHFKPISSATPKCSLADSLQVVSVSSWIKPDLDNVSHEVSSTRTDTQSSPTLAIVSSSISEICTDPSYHRDVREVTPSPLFASSSFVLTSTASNTVTRNPSCQQFTSCSASSSSDNKKSLSPKTQTIRISSVNCASSPMLSSNPNNLSTLYSAPVILPSISNNITSVSSISTSSDLHYDTPCVPQTTLSCLSSTQQKFGTITSHSLTPSNLSLDCIDDLEQDPNKLAYIQQKCMKLRYPVQLALAMSKLCSGSSSIISAYSNRSIERSKSQPHNRRVADHGFLEIDASHFTLNSNTLHLSEKQANKNNNLDRPRTKAQLRRLNSESRLIARVDDKTKDATFSTLGHSKLKQASSVVKLQVSPTCSSDISAKILNSSVSLTEPSTTEGMTREDAFTSKECSDSSYSLNKNNNHFCHKHKLGNRRLKSNPTSVRIKKSYHKHWKNHSIKSTRPKLLNNNNEDSEYNSCVLSKSDSTNLRLLTSVEFVDSSLAKFSKSPYWIEVCSTDSDLYTHNTNLLLGDVIRIICLLLRNRSLLTLINNILKHCWKFCREISISNLRIRNSRKLSAFKPQTENANRLGCLTNLLVIKWPSNNAFKNALAYACQNLPSDGTWLNCCSRSLLCSVSCFILKPEAKRKVLDLSLIVSHFDREVSSIHLTDKINVRKRRFSQADDHFHTQEKLEKDPVFYQRLVSYLPKSFVMLTHLQVNLSTRNIAGLGLLVHCFQNIVNSFIVDHPKQVSEMPHPDNMFSLISQLHVRIANCLKSLRDSYASLISAGACLRARYEIKNFLNTEQTNTNLRIARGRARLFPSDEAARLNICRILRVEIASRLSGFLTSLDKVYIFLKKFITSPILLGPFYETDDLENTTSISFKAWINESLISAKTNRSHMFSSFGAQYSEYMCKFHHISNYLKSVLSKYLFALNSNIYLIKLQLSETHTSIITSWLPTFAQRSECVDQRADTDLQWLTSSLQQQYDSTEAWLRCEHNYKLKFHRSKLLKLFTEFFDSDKDNIPNITIPLSANQLSIPYGSKNLTSATCMHLNLSPLPSWILLSKSLSSAVVIPQKSSSSTTPTVFNDTVPSRTLSTHCYSDIPESRSSLNQINVRTKSVPLLIGNLSDIVRLDAVHKSLPICSNVRVESASHLASSNFIIHTNTGRSPLSKSSLVSLDTISTSSLQKTHNNCVITTHVTNGASSSLIHSVHNYSNSTQKPFSKCVSVSVDTEVNEENIITSQLIKTEDTSAPNKTHFPDFHTTDIQNQDLILQTNQPSYGFHANQEDQQFVNLIPDTETEVSLSRCSETFYSDLSAKGSHSSVSEKLQTLQEGEKYDLEAIDDLSMECNNDSSIHSFLGGSPQCEPIAHRSDHNNNDLCVENHICDKDLEFNKINDQLKSSNVTVPVDTGEDQETNVQSCDQNSHPFGDLTRENLVSQCDSLTLASIWTENPSKVSQSDQNTSILKTIITDSKSLPFSSFHNGPTCVDTPAIESSQEEKCTDNNQIMISMEAELLPENSDFDETNINNSVENFVAPDKVTLEPVAKKVNVYLPNDSISNFLTKDIVTQYASQIDLESETDETGNRLVCLDRRQAGQLKRKLKMIRHAKYNSETFGENTSNLNSAENKSSQSEADSSISQISDDDQLIDSKSSTGMHESYNEVSGGVISDTDSFDGFHKSTNEHVLSSSSSGNNQSCIKNHLLSDLSSNLKNLAPWLEEKVLNHQAPGPVTAAILGQSVVQLSSSHISIDLTVDE